MWPSLKQWWAVRRWEVLVFPIGYWFWELPHIFIDSRLTNLKVPYPDNTTNYRQLWWQLGPFKWKWYLCSPPASFKSTGFRYMGHVTVIPRSHDLPGGATRARRLWLWVKPKARRLLEFRLGDENPWWFIAQMFLLVLGMWGVAFLIAGLVMLVRR